MLTKSAYLAYVQCAKHLWLARYEPELKTPPDPAAQRRLRAGQQVDRHARRHFPDGVSIPYRPRPEAMAPLTAQAIEDGASTLFQATFTHEDLLVKTDILTRTNGGWHLIEVKSSTKAKDEHLPDVAFQLYVLQQSGLEVAEASVMHLNRDCRHPDLSNLFTITDVTDEAQPYLRQVGEDVPAMRRILARREHPDVPIGRHCQKPNTCPFYEHCWQDIDGLTIHDIPRLSEERAEKLLAEDVLYLTEVPENPPLTAKQQAFVEFIVREKINIDRNAIREELDELEYPLYFFDFETIDPAVPVYERCSPYQQVPFQYSCHILHEDGTLNHCEYLHTDGGDPRPALVEALLSDIGETGHVVAYYIHFERRVLRELAEGFPERAPRLLDIADRLWDQLKIFRKYYRHHGFGKSNSLKSVLPVVVPELGYDALDVQNGAQAQVVWEEMVASENKREKERLATRLLEYCHMDTLAMVEMHRVLEAL